MKSVRERNLWLFAGTLLAVLGCALALNLLQSHSLLAEALSAEARLAQWQQDVVWDSVLFGLFTAALLGGLKWHIIREKHRHTERQQALQTTLDKEKRYRLATQATRMGTWEIALNGSALFWDDTLYELYGVGGRQGPLSCEDWLAHLEPRSADAVLKLLNTAQNRTQWTCKVRTHAQAPAPNRVFRVQAALRLEDGSTQASWLGTQMDITEQVEFEHRLKKAEEKFRTAFDRAPMGMVIYNTQGRFVQVNQTACQILGYSRSELLTLDTNQVCHTQDLSLEAPLRTALLAGERDTYQLEMRLIHKTGRVVWTSVSVSCMRTEYQQSTRFIAQIQDVTERKKSEAALIEREHFLRTLSECLPGLVSYWGTDLRCHFANKNYERWTGVPMSKLRAIHMRDMLGEPLFTETQQYVVGALRGQAQRFEKRVQRVDGSWTDTLIHLIPDVLYGQVEGFFALSTDISEIKSQQRELENMNLALTERTAQAEAASRAKSTFLANMSHEIRTPMNAIMGLLQLLDDTVLAPEQRSYLNKIGSAAEVLLNVLNDVLDLSRVEANKLELQCERFTLDDLLTQTMDLFTYRAEEKDIQLFCTKTPDSPASVMGDRLRLAQVLNNLLSNALKFTEVGRIHVELKSLSAEGLLQFSVSDTGPGMSAEQAASLFKPFSQLDSSDTRKHGGAGLGLSICKHLVQLMGGDIWVESTPGQGARFVFTMTCQDPQYQWQEPASSSPPKHSLAKPPASLHTPPPTLDLLQGLRVLVVDDHKLNRLVASEMIRKAGGLVSLAEDGQQAIDACKGSLFDVILMDLQMPTVDGFEASRQIQHLLGDRCPPIVAVTASASEKDRQRILASGMVDHLIKPFHKDRLLAILSGLGHKSPSDA